MLSFIQLSRVCLGFLILPGFEQATYKQCAALPAGETRISSNSLRKEHPPAPIKQVAERLVFAQTDSWIFLQRSHTANAKGIWEILKIES